MRNIILIGMPACGKSTIGVILAKTLGIGFIDTDLVIQEQTGRLLQEIINNDGLDAFCINEERAILSVEHTKNRVIATGGSAVYSRTAMMHLAANGEIFYLHLPIGEIEKRLTNIKTRGVAMKNGQTISDVYAKRKAMYEEYAKYKIECKEKSVEEIVKEISDIIKAIP